MIPRNVQYAASKSNDSDNISSDIIAAVARIYPEALFWLLTEEGEMFQQPGKGNPALREPSTDYGKSKREEIAMKKLGEVSVEYAELEAEYDQLLELTERILKIYDKILAESGEYASEREAIRSELEATAAKHRK